MAAQIPAHPADIAPELAQRLAHALELAGMGVTADLNGQPRREAGIALAQFDVARQRQTMRRQMGGLARRASLTPDNGMDM